MQTLDLDDQQYLYVGLDVLFGGKSLLPQSFPNWALLTSGVSAELHRVWGGVGRTRSRQREATNPRQLHVHEPDILRHPSLESELPSICVDTKA